ncbi:efflux RND transporter periplasmic adaptor subunit [Roseibium salinum]|nr:efflux RND transporter periplasmic adaptor subunit [Roseibium salinum]
MMTSPLAAQSFDCVIDPAVVVKVGSLVPGLLSEVLIERGDYVHKGEIIARLSSETEAATVDLMSEQAASTSEIEAQEARYSLAKSRLVRTRTLAERKITSTDSLEEAIAELEVVTRELAIARMRKRIAGLELNRAKRVLEQKTIRSPIDGVVLERALFRGEYLDQDSQLATIAKLDPLHVEAFIPVSEYGRIHPGMEAVVLPNKPIGGRYTGKVTIIDRVFDAASNTFGLRVELPNPEKRSAGRSPL